MTRPAMEIGNVWRHDHEHDRLHYMLHWADEDGRTQGRHLIERDDTALGKILKTRLKADDQ